MSNSFDNNLILDSLYVRGKGLRITNTSTLLPGTIRFNTESKLFEGYTGQSDELGNTWSIMTRQMASSSVLGSIKIGSNLNINPDGTVSSIAEGVSRFNQGVITICKTPGKADYTVIAEAINQINGRLTPPDQNDPVIILLAPGVYEESIILPDYVSLMGDMTNTATIKINSSSPSSSIAGIKLGYGCSLMNLSIIHDGSDDDYNVGILAHNVINVNILN